MINFILLGVGKSWLLLRWAGEGNKLKGASMPTIGIDFKMKNVDINGRKVKVQVVCTVLVLLYPT